VRAVSAATPVVEIESGRIAGRREQGVALFQGIPFAAPPLGPLRFAPPAPVAAWPGVRSAQEPGPASLQGAMGIPLPGLEVGATSEDCLYLNVAVAEGASASDRRPVLVWIHGGGFSSGSGAQAVYDPIPLTRRSGAVVVTINYRLGVLGSFFSAELCPELENAPGNAGLCDQLAALEWVQRNIGAFGGDCTKVTVFGESAGGMSIGALLASPAARGLFERAIAQSGAAHNVHTPDAASRVARAVLDELGLSGPGAARQLRELRAERFVEVAAPVLGALRRDVGLPFQPVYGTELLPREPLAAISSGSAQAIDVLCGTTREEWRLFGAFDPTIAKLDLASAERRLGYHLPSADSEQVARLVQVYREQRPELSVADLYIELETDRVFRIPALRLLDALASGRGRSAASSFNYRFDWAAPAFGGRLGACHAVEIPFVWGSAGRPGAEIFGAGAQARELAERTMDAWIAFADGGDPGHAKLPRWEAYSPEDRALMRLDASPELVRDPGAVCRRAWDGIL